MKYGRLFSILILWLFTGYRSSAQVLYACYSPSGDSIMYLLGTCHELQKGAYRQEPKIDSLMASVQVVFSEMYLPHLDPTYFRHTKEIQSTYFLENDKTIDDYLSKNERDSLYQYYSKKGQSNLKLFRSIRKYTALRFEQRVMTPEILPVMMDRILLDSALARKQQVVLLDNAEMRIKAYKAFRNVYDYRWLYQITKTDTSLSERNRMLERAYLRQDTMAIKSMLLMSPERAHPEYRAVISDRNARWKELIRDHGKRTGFLFCGIAHLLDEESGLLEWYVKKGWNVEPVYVQIAL